MITQLDRDHVARISQSARGPLPPFVAFCHLGFSALSRENLRRFSRVQNLHHTPIVSQFFDLYRQFEIFCKSKKAFPNQTIKPCSKAPSRVSLPSSRRLGTFNHPRVMIPVNSQINLQVITDNFCPKSTSKYLTPKLIYPISQIPRSSKLTDNVNGFFRPRSVASAVPTGTPRPPNQHFSTAENQSTC